jgi:uncharacterized protein YjiK
MPWDAERIPTGCNDLSSITFHAPSGRLLLLSDESACVVECATNGQEVARMALRAGTAGLTQDVQRPEGICFDSTGTMYICCEPNLLYIFDPPAKP